MARYQPRHSRGRTARRTFVAMALLIAVLAGNAVAFRTSLFAAAVRTGFADLGLGPVELTVTRANLSGFQITTFQAANGQIKAREISGTYSLAALRDGRLLTLVLDGLELQGEWLTDRVTLAGLDQSTLAMGEPTNPDTARFPVDVVTITNASAEIGHPSGPLRATGGLYLRAIGSEFEFGADVEIKGPSLTGAFEAEGLYKPENILASEMSGTLQLTAREFDVPGAATALSIIADVTMDTDQGRAGVSLNQDLLLAGPWPDSWPNLSGPNLSGDPGRASLTISRPDGNTELLQVSQTESGLRVDTNLLSAWDTPIGRGTLAVAGWTTVGAGGFPDDFEFRSLSLELNETSTPYGVISGRFSGDGMKGPAGNAAGRIDLNVNISDGRFPAEDSASIRFTSGSLNVLADAKVTGLTLGLDLNDVAFTMDGLAGPGFRSDSQVRLNLAGQASKSQTVTLPLVPRASSTASGVEVISAELLLRATPLKILIEELDSPLLIDLEMPDIGASVLWTADQPQPEGHIAIREAVLKSDTGVIDNLSVTAQLGRDGVSGDYLGRLTRVLTAPPAAPRLALQGQFEYSNNIITNQLYIAAPSGKMLAEIEGGFNLDNGYVQGRLSTGRLTFGGTGLGPSDLRPLGLPFTPVSGQLAVDAEVRLDEADIQSGTLFVQDLEVESPAGRFEKINTVVTLSSVWPPQSAPNQTAAIGLLQAGVPITNVFASFEVVPTAVAVNSVSMEFAGGTIRGEPMRLNLDGSDSTGKFTVNGVQMPEIARLSGLTGLETSGILSGMIPVRVSGPDIYIEGGTLTTEGPGAIRFKPDAATSAAASGQGGMALAMQALENFEYDSITMRVNGSLNKDLEAALAIKGRNPDLYGGYPIDFNLSLSGELANVLRDSLAGYRVPEAIKQQLLAFPPAGGSR